MGLLDRWGADARHNLDDADLWHGQPGIAIGFLAPWFVLGVFLALKAHAVLPPPGNYYDTLPPPGDGGFWFSGFAVRARRFYVAFWAEVTIVLMTAAVSLLAAGLGVLAASVLMYALPAFGLLIAALRTVQRKRHKGSNLVRLVEHEPRKGRRAGRRRK